MLLVPKGRLIALTALLAGLAQPSLADSAPANASKVKSLSSARMVLVKPKTDNGTPNVNPRLPVPSPTVRQKTGSCAKSKPAFGDADFNFQGYKDAGIRC